MRPSRLTMHAFGPYANEQVIDFSALQGRTLFLIHGPTGAGKTTILDAMCYALYGDTSGGERTGRHLRSDHASPETLTEVELEFELGRTLYKIRRRPEQAHVRKSGKAPVTVKHEAKLWKRQASAADSKEWTLVTGMTKQVNIEVEGLLGFRSDQFRQVVMLPQGQFRQLLVSSSRDREKILGILFRTAVYKGIEEQLKQAARSIEDGVKQGRQKVGLVQMAGAEVRDDILLRIQTNQAALEQLIQEKTRQQVQAQESQERLNQAMLVTEKLKEVSEAKGAFRVLEAKAPDFATMRLLLEQARRALSLVPEENALEKRLQEAEDARNNLKKARTNLERSRRQREYTEQQLEKEKARQGELDDRRRELVRLDALTEKVKGIEQIRLELGQAVAAWQNSRKVLADSKMKLEENASKLEEKQQALRDTEKIAERAELLKTQQKQAQDNCEHRKKLEEYREGYSVTRRDLAQVSKTFAKTEQAFAKAESVYTALEAAWAEGQAAVLAHSLVPGEPCPVCGALEHPTPASSEREVPTDTALKNAKRELERLRTARQEAQEKKTQLESRLREIQAVAEVLSGQLVGLESKTPEELQSELQAIKAEVAKAVAAGERIKKISGEMDALRKAMDLAAAAQQEAEKRGQLADANRVRLDGTLEERQRGVPKELGTETALDQAKKAARDAMDRLEKALDAAVKEQLAAEKKFSAAQSSLEAAEQSDALAAERSLAQQQEFAKGLKDAGFMDLRAYQSVRRTPAEIAQMEARIAKFDNERSAAVDRLKRAEELAERLEQPDILALTAAAKKATKDLELAVGQEVSVREALKRDAESLATLDLSTKELDALEQQYAVMGRISEVANGKNREGISFQRFVLAALLDDVMFAASERLRIMSDRRFSLARVRERSSGHGAGGLDLEVHDAYTGTTRPVETLSGGEGFLASLSLALGLADVVQSYSGGIRLDTVFVDEGFGSLDPESLDLAYRALVDLQSSGRLVGIISHVPDLREQINVRLEVSAGRNGSTARFVIG